MSFKTNGYQQMSLTDSITGLTAREQKALEKSWAKPFAEDIFPAIDEERFSVLYSSKASRPNTPVNVIVGALIIKELFDLSDDDVVENLMLDPRYQYALHTTSFAEQPLSDKTLTRFRQRCYEYESATNTDLYGDCVKDLSAKIAKLMNVSGQIRRMDSLMVDSNIRKLSRTELIYRCISKMLHYIDNRKITVPEGMEHYLDDNDFNRQFYHKRSSNTDDTLDQLLADCDKLFAFCGSDYEGVTEYDLFVRCLAEQTIVENEQRRLRTKEDGGMNSGILQNPSDPDATYREKAGKEYRGYVLNVEESVGPEGSVITDYQFEQNIHSDSQFLKERMGKLELQTEPVILVADGAYSGADNTAAAAEKNVTLVTTDLTGKETEDILADFSFSEDGKRVLSCPAGHKPTGCTYYSSKGGRCYVSFPRECCVNCPHQGQCKANIYKKKATVMVSKTSHDRALSQRFHKTETFRNLAKIRNGVETVPSLLRRRYNIDRMPRGLQRGRFFAGSKIAALNFRKLFTMRKGTGNYAQNAAIA